MTKHWLYYRVYPLDGLAKFVSSPVLRTTVDVARTVDPRLRWFFLQFQDAVGVHVRLRVETSVETVTEVDDAVMGALHDCTMHRGVYSPETAKFGSSAALHRAEDVFHASSELATSLPPSRRVGVAAAQMLRTAACLPPRSRRSFLHRYWWYWSGGPTGAPVAAPDPDTSAPVVSRLVAQMRGTLAHEPTAVALDRYIAVLVASLQLSSPATADRLALHHVHLTDNRLGLAGAGEARLARLLWLADRSNMTTCTPGSTNVHAGSDGIALPAAELRI